MAGGLLLFIHLSKNERINRPRITACHYTGLKVVTIGDENVIAMIFYVLIFEIPSSTYQ